ncbi:hypothetical protein T265_00569 [Opisthorchis viverrini]|uniref:Uncharacterized protein n=1 Tax=Opisthorchis viverrini TaxID=6198 RepID=A0A075A2X6_OPIVI|nr:hypothetical protein T265_00569 [Opisthorchis viverrini]KER33686.1 hypothetical protein T265_00569 [Opisthorchis viverrini]
MRFDDFLEINNVFQAMTNVTLFSLDCVISWGEWDSSANGVALQINQAVPRLKFHCTTSINQGRHSLRVVNVSIWCAETTLAPKCQAGENLERIPENLVDTILMEEKLRVKQNTISDNFYLEND